MLPFLKRNKLPKIGKPTGTSHYGFSEEELAANEIIEALESNNNSEFMSALQALIELIRNKHDASNDEEAKLA